MTRKIEDLTAPYLEAHDIDAVMRINTSLLGEIWLLRDRLAIMERLLDAKAILNAKEIDTFVPDAEMEADLEKMRAQMIERTLKYSNTKNYSVQSLVEGVGAG